MHEHPRLAPGVRVVPRGPDHLQVGLLGHPLVLPRTPLTESLLDALGGCGPLPRAAGTRDLLARLAEHDLLRRSPPAPARVLVQGCFPTDPRPLLAEMGLDRSVPPTHGLALLATDDDQPTVDHWHRVGLPHLVLRVIDGWVVVGPYVVPGVTACLHCLDAHAAEDGAAAVTRLYAEASTHPPPDGLDESLDPALAQIGVAWAVRDLASAAEGRRPATWSATLEIGPGLHDTRHRTWLRHPACGCGWGASGTLEA